MMPRRRLVHGNSVLPSFMGNDFNEPKSKIRTATAQYMKKHVGRKAPAILCMPYYEALCVKAINSLIPDAVFVGLEQVQHVAEMFAEAAPGKKIEVRPLSLENYVQTGVDLNRFDAAFLDFMGEYSQSRLDQIAAFTKTKMRKRFVVAITMQGDEHVNSVLTRDLASAVGQLSLVYSTAYFTQTQMCHSIFVGRS
jgi:hypothetical protein